MRSYKTDYNLADPGVWASVSNMFPTRRGSYATAKQYPAGQSLTATGEVADSAFYAYAFPTTTSYVAWLGTTSKIWNVASTLSDKTNGVATGTSKGVMCQYGNNTILATGIGGSELATSASGGNFGTFSTGLKADFVVTQSNCLLAFSTAHASLANTGGDAWAASDVGDYTNFTPSASVDAANGRLLQTGGQITGAIAWKGAVYAFKRDAIYRGTYVGFPYFWQWEVVYTGIGMAITEDWARRAIISCGDFIVFPAYYDSTLSIAIFAFDGSTVRRLNPDTSVLVASTTKTTFHHDARENQLRISANASSGSSYCYDFSTGNWGIQTCVNGVAILGGYADVSYMFKAIYASAGYPAFWNMFGPILLTSGTDTVTIKSPTNAATGSQYTCSMTTSRFGSQGVKTTFKRFTPILRSRGTIGNSAPAASGQIQLYLELHDASQSGVVNVTEGTVRDRFEGFATDCFARMFVSYVDTAIEIDDIEIVTAPAGTD